MKLLCPSFEQLIPTLTWHCGAREPRGLHMEHAPFQLKGGKKVIRLDVWSNITTALNKVISSLSAIVPAVAILGLIICGLLFLISNEKAREGKDKIFKVIQGCVIALGATSIITWLQSILQFTQNGAS